MQAFTFEARLPEPTNSHEQKCQACSHPATTVINAIPECDEHAGMRVLAGENPELIGKMIADYLGRMQNRKPQAVFNQHGVGGPTAIGVDGPVTDEDLVAQVKEATLFQREVK
jgi:hypothetical protein